VVETTVGDRFEGDEGASCMADMTVGDGSEGDERVPSGEGGKTATGRFNRTSHLQWHGSGSSAGGGGPNW
jgi:hypothetical protein